MKQIEELHNKSFRLLFYDEMSEYDQTIASLKEDLSETKNSNGFNNLGVAYFEIGEYEKAIDALNKAIELNSSNDIAYINRAELNKKWNKLKESEYDYTKAIELNSKNATYFRCRAYLRKENGDLQNSLIDFKSANKIEPKFQPTINELKEIENRLGIKKENWFQKIFAK